MGEKNDEDILLEKKINTDKGLNAAFFISRRYGKSSSVVDVDTQGLPYRCFHL